MRWRHELLKVLFDQVWIVGSRQAESFRHTFHMSIDDDTRLAESISQDHIGRFSADTRQSDQLIHCMWDLSAEAFGHGFSAANKMFRFVLEKTGRTNKLFDFREISRSHLCRFPIPSEECRSNLVDSLVSALGGKNCGHEQFPGGTMIKFHLRVLHRELERLGNLSEAFSLVRCGMGVCWHTGYQKRSIVQSVKAEMQV